MKQSPRKLTRVVCVVELLAPPSGQPLDFVQVVVSIPGREGTFTRTWTLPDHKLTEPVWRDVVTMVERELLVPLEVLGGSQIVLDGL